MFILKMYIQAMRSGYNFKNNLDLIQRLRQKIKYLLT